MGNLFVADPTCADKKKVCPFIPLVAGSQRVTLPHRFTESSKINVTDVKCRLRILEIRPPHLINVYYLDYKKNVIIYISMSHIYNFEITPILR